MRRKSKIYSEMLLGNRYTNVEALVMMDHFKQTADLCVELGPRFALAFIEANTQYMRLRDVCEARGI